MKEETTTSEEQTSQSRRQFLRTLGSGAALGGLAAMGLPGPLRAAVPADLRGWLDYGDRTTPGFWQAVRAGFVLDPSRVYMNVGTTGSMPRHVLQDYNKNNLAVASDPRDNLGGSTAMRAELAAHYGCNTDELVISNNTTDGLCMTLNGLTLGKGDEIVTTNHEHPSATAPMALLRDRRGVDIRVVDVPVGPDQHPDDFVSRFADAITHKTKLFVFSAPTFITGTMLPIRRLADLAIANGIYTLVDGAHATGMFDLDFHALGVDFFAGSGHKWQCGPGGSGIWYIRNQTDPDYNPLPLPPFYPTRTLLYDLIPGGGRPDGGRRTTGNPTYDDMALFNQLHGNPNYPAYRALADSAQFWTDIGRRAIEDYILDLSAYTKELIIQEWGRHTLYSATHSELVSALTAFTPFPTDRKNRAKIETFVDRLREEFGYVVRFTSVHLPGEADDYAIRVSTHLFHDRREVEGVVQAMAALAAQMG